MYKRNRKAYKETLLLGNYFPLSGTMEGLTSRSLDKWPNLYNNAFTKEVLSGKAAKSFHRKIWESFRNQDP